MSDMSRAGLPQLVQEIKLASENIRRADDTNREKLEAIEASVNDLYKRVGRPGNEWSGDSDERKSAIEMCRTRHNERLPKSDLVTAEYVPSSTEIEEAIIARRALPSFIRHGNLDRFDGSIRKSLSSFSFGSTGFLLPPERSNVVLSCLTDPTDLSGLFSRVSISSSSITFPIDNSRMMLAAWACESGCFSNNPMPDLQDGLGELNIKAETIRFVVCATRDLLEDAAFDVEGWLFRKVSEGMRGTINAAILLGDGVGKPLGILNQNSGIPICEVSPATNPGTFSWQDLIMLAMEIPIQWQAGASFLMNQRTAALLLTMSDATGKPLLGSMQGLHDGPRWTLCGFPVNIASQMPDCAPGATPVAFGNWAKVYTIVERKGVTMQIDPYSSGFCSLYKFETRVGGATTCSNAARLLRVR